MCFKIIFCYNANENNLTFTFYHENALPFVCKPSKQSNHKTIKFVYKISIPIEFPFH